MAGWLGGLGKGGWPGWGGRTWRLGLGRETVRSRWLAPSAFDVRHAPPTPTHYHARTLTHTLQLLSPF